MSDHSFPSAGWVDLSHAVHASTVGACRMREMSAPDGGPLFALTIIGRCRCQQTEGDEERTALLRGIDVINVIAALTDCARNTDIGDTLTDRVEAVIEATRERLGVDTGCELIAVCSSCGRQVADCGCDHHRA